MLAVATASCATGAQTREGRIPGERRDCRAAAARLSAGQATAETFRTLGWCDETGPAALVAVWRRPLPDTARLGAFLFASGNIRDKRVFSAAFVAAQDSTRRPVERAAALLVLVAQVDSAATVGIGPGLRSEPWRAALLHETHPRQVRGTEPLPSDAPSRVVALAQKLATGRPKGAAALRDPISAAVQDTQLALKRLPR